MFLFSIFFALTSFYTKLQRSTLFYFTFHFTEFTECKMLARIIPTFLSYGIHSHFVWLVLLLRSFLLKHFLRKYQHIGLDWHTTMYERKLNYILTDEIWIKLYKLSRY